MFSALETSLLSLINTLPLEIFVFVASYIEEVFAPIPSVAVLLMTGAFASVQNWTLVGLLPLAILAAVGKTLGALTVYYISGKIGRIIVTKFGHFFEITPESIEEFGKKITGSPRDYILLIVLRAVPVVPSAVISVGSGLMKISLPIFIVTTFIGSFMRDVVFLYMGYTGTELISQYHERLTSLETVAQAMLLLAAFGIFIYVYLRRKRKGAINSIR